MSQLTNRRAFLSAQMLREEKEVLRPPGALETGFFDLCTRCGDCVRACPEAILGVDSSEFPVVHLNSGACTFCGDCARSCESGALDIARLADWPWRATVDGGSCLSMNGISCRLCQDNCDQDAIRFQLKLAGRAQPVLDQDSCTGCGACAASCPVSAVSFERPAIPQTEAIR